MGIQIVQRVVSNARHQEDTHQWSTELSIVTYLTVSIDWLVCVHDEILASGSSEHYAVIVLSAYESGQSIDC